jgi:hypothetical protein
MEKTFTATFPLHRCFTGKKKKTFPLLKLHAVQNNRFARGVID